MASPILEAMTRKANLAMGIIEYEIDKFQEGGYKSSFNMEKYLNQLDFKPKVVQIMIDDYDRMVRELNSTEEDMMEAYSYMTSAEKQKFISFIEKIIKGANTYLNKNQQRWERERANRKMNKTLRALNKKYQ
jgi:transposase